MSQTTVNLGYVLKNRGEYIAEPETRYYHDNVVQYQGSSFIADPVDYNPDTNPLAYVTVAPYDVDPDHLNEGWKVFASDAAYVNSFMFFTENPEWAYVVCDNEDKVLFGVKQDGEFYFGAGCPPQVKSYIEEKISALSLDEYEAIVAFLDGLIGSDTTLKMMLDSLEENKVDKEEGKSLIDSEHADAASHTENPEYLQVTTDSEDKVLEGIKQDGTKVIGGDLNVGGFASINGDAKILGNVEVSGILYKVIENQEYLAAWVDREEKVVFGLKADGKTYVGDADFLNEIKNNQEAINEIKSILANIPSNIDWDALSSITAVENPEYIEAKTDSEGKLLAGRTPDGAAFENVGFSTPKVSTESVDIDGHIIENIEDPEGRSEIKTDNKGKIISYRDENGVLHESVSIETNVLTANSFVLPQDTKEEVKNTIDTHISPKNWYLPKFGKVNIKSETFYLTADSRWSTKDDVICIQMLDDTIENAQVRATLSFYYIKSTLTPISGGVYDRTSVNEESVMLELFAGKEVAEDNGKFYVKKITKVDGIFYLTSTLKATEVEGTTVYSLDYLYDLVASVKVNYIDNSIPDQTTLTNAIEVIPVIDTPPYKAWAVNKGLEHYCIADIDFGTFYSKNNVPVSIKYQGSGTQQYRKRGFRLTFYKKNDYKKKDKVKIGEMVRLSGYNMKSYATDSTRIKDPIISNTFIEMWGTNGKDAYPWNMTNCSYNGATGMIKSFPIETWFGNEFFGLQFFGLKKDEKNYMLDGDNDSSGIFVSGANDSMTKCFDNADHTDFEDEMMDEMSQETADAIDELCKYAKGFVDGTIEIDGQVVDFTNNMLEEHIYIDNWIDYWIGLELFQLHDNAFHNVILYSDSSKKKFSLFFYDLDNALQFPEDSSYIEIMNERGWNIRFWEKFVNEYKDYIINRYAYLRKNVLKIENITAIYNAYYQVPQYVIEEESSRWGKIQNFDEMLSKIEARMNYLDRNYFNL